jgi:hypothetical protein
LEAAFVELGIIRTYSWPLLEKSSLGPAMIGVVAELGSRCRSLRRRRERMAQRINVAVITPKTKQAMAAPARVLAETPPSAAIFRPSGCEGGFNVVAIADVEANECVCWLDIVSKVWLSTPSVLEVEAVVSHKAWKVNVDGTKVHSMPVLSGRPRTTGDRTTVVTSNNDTPELSWTVSIVTE